MDPLRDKSHVEWWAYDTIHALERRVKVYDHMVKVAHANGYAGLGAVMAALDKFNSENVKDSHAN